MPQNPEYKPPEYGPLKTNPNTIRKIYTSTLITSLIPNTEIPVGYRKVNFWDTQVTCKSLSTFKGKTESFSTARKSGNISSHIEKLFSSDTRQSMKRRIATERLYNLYRKPTFTGQYIRWNPFSPKTRKISLIKTLVHRALMICSKNKLGSELDKIKQLLIENGYPADVLLSCINQKLANFAEEKTFGPEKCPVYLKLPWIGNVSSKFENQINKAITSCFYAVKPRVVYSTRVMLPSAKKDSVPTTQKSCVVYEFSCQCKVRFLSHT